MRMRVTWARRRKKERPATSFHSIPTCRREAGVKGCSFLPRHQAREGCRRVAGCVLGGQQRFWRLQLGVRHRRKPSALPERPQELVQQEGKGGCPGLRSPRLTLQLPRDVGSRTSGTGRRDPRLFFTRKLLDPAWLRCHR